MSDLRLTGRPIEIRYQANLRDAAGNAAHASTFIRDRVIVLDEELQSDSREHLRILLHELLHFVWVRAGNARRLAWETLLRTERAARARGECGWSAEWRKGKLRASDVDGRTRAWREYCCESFCDTGAWIFGGDEAEVTLSDGHRRKRQAWFRQHLGKRDIPL